ncbi:MAG: type II toxin-antitoxin system HicA family toxin [Pseudomonadota bacterium]
MGAIPVLKAKEVVRLLELLGFFEVRQRGSHKQFRHKNGWAATVPVQGTSIVRKIRSGLLLIK